MADPLVLVPGLQSDASSWMPLIEKLCHRNAVSVPMGHQFDPDLGTMAGRVLVQSPGRFHLIGWSMGGYIAFEILRRAPERLASLVLLSTSAAPEADMSLPKRRAALVRAGTEGLRAYQDANLDLCLFDRASVDRARIETLLSAAESLGLSALEIQTRAIVARPDSRPDLAASRLPVLIVAGREDRIIPIDHAREMRALRPDAAYVEIADCGHCPPLEKPDLLAGILGDWVAGQSA